MVGRGVDEPPQVNLVDDSPAFGTPEVGDTVLTAGGDNSLAPADIPIGVVSDGAPRLAVGRLDPRGRRRWPSWTASSSCR